MAASPIPSPFPPPLTHPPDGGNHADSIPPFGSPPKEDLKTFEQAEVPGFEEPRKINLTQAWDYFTGGQFDKDISVYQACSNFVTGYKNLDAIQPFYPGLYCLGAISSLGKTTFCQQMADQIAAAGFYVLYFSLEQSRFELFSKSLARGFYRTNREEARKNNRPSVYPTPSSMDIRRGLTSRYPQEMARQIDAYLQTVQKRLYVVDGAFSLTVEDIRSVTEAMIRKLGVSPVVLVDYLQIIAPSLVNGRIPDTKTSIDHIVHSLKALQTDYNLSVVAISSLNRQNYLTPIDFESFKESGGIEYTADVIWGLQLSVLNDKSFYHHYDNAGKQKGETSLKEKREKIQQEKASTPRHVDLVCLKNRYGISSYSLHFDYFPASDYFLPLYDPNDPMTWA